MTDGTPPARTRIRRVVRRYPLASFFVLAFAWTWTYAAIVFVAIGSSPGILARGVVSTWGPLVAAAIVTRACGGSLRAWAGRVTKWRVRPRWYLFALVLPFAFEGQLAVSALHVASGGSIDLAPSPWWHYVANFLLVMFFAGSLEEFGWRGFAQPRLQERYSALTAAIVVGIAWGLWHLPMFYLYDVAAYDASTFWTTYLLASVTSSVVYAWLYNGTGGSLLFPMLAHALGNLPPIVTPSTEVWWGLHYASQVLVVLFVLGLILVYGPAYLAPRVPTELVPGRLSDTDGRRRDGSLTARRR